MAGIGNISSLVGLAAAPFTGGTSLLATALPSLIQAGTGLLGGFLKGAQTEKEQKKAYETWQKSRATQRADLDKIMGQRYRTARDLPAIDPMLKKLLVGRMSEFVSPELSSKYGIDFTKLLSGLGGGVGAGYNIPTGPAEANVPNIPREGPLRKRPQRGTPELAQNILGKYAEA